MDENQIIKKLIEKPKQFLLLMCKDLMVYNKFLKVLKQKKIVLLEDVCESHGALFNKKKLGSLWSYV